MKSPNHNASELISGSRLARNTLFNLVGYLAPLAVALFAIPLLISGLGTDRFGILTLAWVLIGYLSLLDFGLGRALTQLVADRLGQGRTGDIKPLIGTALAVMILIGVLIAAAASLPLHWVVGDLLRIPSNLIGEAMSAFYLVLFSVPLVVASVAFRGILDAHQRFDLTNLVRIPLGIYTFLAPLAVLPFSHNLVAIIGVIILGRVGALCLQISFCRKIIPRSKARAIFDVTLVKPLFRFGIWMTVTNVLVPAMMYADRFLIGTWYSMTAVAYYAIPSEVVTKLLLISGSLMAVLFPAFATSGQLDPEKADTLFHRSSKTIAWAMYPIALVIVGWAPELLEVWLGDEFAVNSARVMQLLTLGVFFISVGQIPYAYVQGVGRPDLTAKLHLLEAPLYLLLLIAGIRWAGIQGAALVWMIRALIDTIALYFIARRMLSSADSRLLGRGRRTVVLIVATLSLAALLFIPGLLLRSALACALLIVYGLFSGRIVFTPAERAALKRTFTKTFRLSSRTAATRIEDDD